ncbi:type II toxin-antitoxin system VapC family toxin [Nocardia otitidiscaviarum]|uniref:Ribonuclease VapC n=1 Tax=Nocardia otitidiscaviarum TaxID=1823 RepID=A0A516NSZ8_9NOCA|nr:type II toxin-antitoxin system VapC family toxin [Nocardia otitidiscaviarum]MCP9621317.1 type II toxin-antitoxin system VapC family toxin [Nocardia otitidiscaviarum]QDP82036.1 type II toxin-antitoxin system VapC family toxin [Nocardia otitidiscaviarum]
MIILDTNVISETSTKAPNPRVLAWLDAQNAETLFLAAVTVGELRYGIAVMPAGRRRDEYTDWLENLTIPSFSGRILPYDLAATAQYAHLMSTARAAGLAISPPDGMIAATASAAGFAVATRDTAPFEAAGLPVINPWQ